MTMIPRETYDIINDEILKVIDTHKKDMSEYDMLIIIVNFLSSYMDVILKFHPKMDERELIEDVFDLIRAHRFNYSKSKN